MKRLSTTLVTCFLAFTLTACSALENSRTMKQSMPLDFVKITDSAGLVYIGAYIKESQLQSYLSQLKQHKPQLFAELRESQIKRDHGKFHLTLINPYEYRDLTEAQKAELTKTANIAVELHGLGSVSKTNQSTFYVIATSERAQNLRRAVGLKDKDFHITLGFTPSDIYDMRKDISTLVR